MQLRDFGASSFSTSLTILRGCQPGPFSFPYLNGREAGRVFNDGCRCHLAKTQPNPQTVDLPTFSTFLVVVKYARALAWAWTRNLFQRRLAAGVLHLHIQFVEAPYDQLYIIFTYITKQGHFSNASTSRSFSSDNNQYKVIPKYFKDTKSCLNTPKSSLFPGY